MELITIQRFWPLKQPWRCPNCKMEGSFRRISLGQDKCILITCEGRYDLDDCNLACEHCSFVLDDRLPAIIDSGFWPGNLIRKYQYLFSKKLFTFFDYLHKFLPGTSIGGFLHTLEEVSTKNGRASVINQEAFIKSFEEFRYCCAEILKMQHVTPFECPACHKRQHSAHIDGNKKLYRFSKVARGVRESYYKGTFFVANEDVDHHLKAVNYQDGSEQGMCGTSRWKAAKAASNIWMKLVLL